MLLRRLLVVGGVLGAALGASSAFAQVPAGCEWEMAGIPEDPGAECYAPADVEFLTPVPVEVTNDLPWSVQVSGSDETLPVAEQGATGSTATVEQLEGMRRELVLGLGVLIFVQAIALVGSWVLLRRSV